MAGNLVANLTKLPQESFCTAFLIGASQAPLATPVADISSGNELICYFPTLWPSGRSLLKYGGKFGGQSDKTATGVLLHSFPYRRQPSALGDSCGRHLLGK